MQNNDSEDPDSGHPTPRDFNVSFKKIMHSMSINIQLYNCHYFSSRTKQLRRLRFLLDSDLPQSVVIQLNLSPLDLYSHLLIYPIHTRMATVNCYFLYIFLLLFFSELVSDVIDMARKKKELEEVNDLVIGSYSIPSTLSST